MQINVILTMFGEIELRLQHYGKRPTNVLFYHNSFISDLVNCFHLKLKLKN